MKTIPVLDSSSVAQRPIGANLSNQNYDTGVREVAHAIGGLGEVAQEAYQRANGVAANNAVSQLEAEVTSNTDGSGTGVGGKQEGEKPFMATRGMEAAARSEETMAKLNTRRKELAATLSNDEQRALFYQHSRPLLQGTRRRVEAHVAKERHAAEVASIEGRMATSLQSIANNYSDEGGTASQASAAVEQTLRAFALSPEDAEAKVLAWRGRVAETRINRYLGAKDWKGAQDLFAVAKDSMPEAGRYQKQIDAVRKDGVADSMAHKLVDDNLAHDGRVDVATALEELEKSDEKDVDVRDEARRRLKQLATERDAAWETETKRVSSEAFTAYNSGGWRGIPGQLKLDLNERNPALYDRLKDDSERKYRSRRLGDAEARREQAEIDRVARNDYLALPAADRAKQDLDEFLAGRGVSDGMASELKVHKRTAGETVQRGEVSSETSYKAQAKAAANGVVKGKTRQKAFEAEALLEYSRLTQQLKHAPSKAEADEAIGKLLEKAMTDPGFFGPSEEFEFERRARERREGKPERSPAEAPKAGPAPTPAAAPASRLPVADRVRQLRRGGKSNKEIADTLNAEGYTREGP